MILFNHWFLFCKRIVWRSFSSKLCKLLTMYQVSCYEIRINLWLEKTVSPIYRSHSHITYLMFMSLSLYMYSTFQNFRVLLYNNYLTCTNCSALVIMSRCIIATGVLLTLFIKKSALLNVSGKCSLFNSGREQNLKCEFQINLKFLRSSWKWSVFRWYYVITCTVSTIFSLLKVVSTFHLMLGVFNLHMWNITGIKFSKFIKQSK